MIGLVVQSTHATLLQSPGIMSFKEQTKPAQAYYRLALVPGAMNGMWI
jgi:hypothetical protein